MAYIKKESIDRVFEESDIVKVFEKLCPDTKKKGVNYVCKSPFNDENTASCVVSPAKQIYKDFSSGNGGNVVSFIMEHQRLQYVEAIEWLASFFNIPLEYEDAEWAKKKQEKLKKKEEYRPLLKVVLAQYRKAFRALPDDHNAKQEVYGKRQYTDDQVVEWEIGYAPGKKFIYQNAYGTGALTIARELNLVGDNADKYWSRVIYPIHDVNGLLIGLAGRNVSTNEKAAKWINPNDNELYKKDKVWYALHKAKRAITKTGEAWLVEGYNDVIAWHTYGLENTVASCGTAITTNQIKVLSRYTKKVILCMDPDPAGLKSALKHIPLFLSQDFIVQVATLPVDPDDFVRKYPNIIERVGLSKMMNHSWEIREEKKTIRKSVKVDGFKFLMDHLLTGNEIEDSKVVNELLEVIANISDTSMKDIYTKWLSKESGFTVPQLNKWKKEVDQKIVDRTSSGTNDWWETYILPSEVTTPIEELKPIIEKYGMFQDNNRIWIKQGDDAPYTFKAVSNFSIEIIQHMQDEKFPMKLIRIKNVRNKERIFDTLSDNLNSPMQFTNVMAGHGNFLFKGKREDHLKLLEYMFDKMGDGDKVDVLGWQASGFFVFSNLVVIPGKGNIEIDENGVFKVDKTHYYVPAANKVYRNNPYKYMAQKRIVATPAPDFSFTDYCSKMIAVHRGHAITGILFTIASIFQDVVINKTGAGFPIPFLYGPPSTGKDQLIECCQSFFGKPQEAISLESGTSTDKAQIREFAQFQNMIGHLSEYKRGNPKVDGMLKALWDRRGYKRGTIDSHVGSESIPILSSTFLTGNDYPDNDALITRVIWEEMTKGDFSPEEIKMYDQLKDMTNQGISHFTVEILQHREKWETLFKETYRRVVKTIKQDMGMLATQARIIHNNAVLGATYELMKDDLQFPFSWGDFMSHAKESIDRQLRKLNTASLHSKWWDIFLATVRTETAPLVHEVDFSIKDGRLYFNMKNTWNRITTQWYRQYQETTPSKAKISDTLRDNLDLALQEHATHRFDGSSNGKRTSAFSVELSATQIQDELMEAIEWQENQKRAGTWSAPATPYSSIPTTAPSSDGKQGDLPF